MIPLCFDPWSYSGVAKGVDCTRSLADGVLGENDSTYREDEFRSTSSLLLFVVTWTRFKSPELAISFSFTVKTTLSAPAGNIPETFWLSPSAASWAAAKDCCRSTGSYLCNATRHDRTIPFHFLFGMSNVWSGVDGVTIDLFWRFSLGIERQYTSYPMVFLPLVMAFRRCWILWSCCGLFGSSLRKILSCLEASSHDLEWNLIFFREFFPIFWYVGLFVDNDGIDDDEDRGALFVFALRLRLVWFALIPIL